MRIIGSIATALMILGLAAFSVVSGQKLNGGSPLATAFNPTAAPAPPAARRHLVNPVSQIAQIGADTAPMANAPANVAPVRLVQATETPSVSSGSALNASAQPKTSPQASSIPM